MSVTKLKYALQRLSNKQPKNSKAVKSFLKEGTEADITAGVDRSPSIEKHYKYSLSSPGMSYDNSARPRLNLTTKQTSASYSNKKTNKRIPPFRQETVEIISDSASIGSSSSKKSLPSVTIGQPLNRNNHSTNAPNSQPHIRDHGLLFPSNNAHRHFAPPAHVALQKSNSTFRERNPSYRQALNTTTRSSTSIHF